MVLKYGFYLVQDSEAFLHNFSTFLFFVVGTKIFSKMSKFGKSAKYTLLLLTKITLKPLQIMQISFPDG